ncbi:hypothetical protein WUBG_10106 [Wuchereria bancrofti]|uniref:Phospholipase A2 n=1 Tax=Wuchereria bancrofti TaxID=6293 RepID=J9EA09_WUCBA|nr:hypothetical protein WUBG_10106 [Wuchereria bancrofti]
MWLFAGIILVYGDYASCIESGPMPFDLRLLYQTFTKAHISLHGEVESTAIPRNIRNSYNNSTDNNGKLANEGITWECESINQCCIEHDDCYSEQRGRKYCDDTFCACLDVATKSSKICNKRDGQSFCLIVRNFGEYAYNEAGKESMKTALPRIFSPRPTR